MILFKGPKGEMKMDLHEDVIVDKKENTINVEVNDKNSAMAGTMRSLISNNVIGVSEGYEKKLNLVGVGYKQVVTHQLALVADGVGKGLPAVPVIFVEAILNGYDGVLVAPVLIEAHHVRAAEAVHNLGRD